jgi:hypothetical protein
LPTIQDGIWTSDDPDFDYDKMKTDIYEALLAGRRVETERPEDYVGKVRPSSVTERLIDLQSIGLDAYEIRM